MLFEEKKAILAQRGAGGGSIYDDLDNGDSAPNILMNHKSELRVNLSFKDQERMDGI
jgi:hypothetical protein